MRPITALALAATLTLCACLAEGPKPPTAMPGADLAQIDIDIGPGAHALELIRPADKSYEFSRYNNDLAENARIIRTAAASYVYYATDKEGRFPFHLLQPDATAPDGLVAAFRPIEEGDAPVYMFLTVAADEIAILPLSKSLFDAWLPGTPAATAARAHLAKAGAFTATKVTAQDDDDLRALMEAARAFPEADRAIYRLVPAPQDN